MNSKTTEISPGGREILTSGRARRDDQDSGSPAEGGTGKMGEKNIRKIEVA